MVLPATSTTNEASRTGPASPVSSDQVASLLGRVRGAIERVIVGQTDVVDQVLWALLAGGHVLLEGAPGLGKTLLVRAVCASVDLSFSRIQFTPDLMPSDVTGNHVLVTTSDGGRRFELQRGPIFAQVVLADEINRATPKTQSALLEAMQEHAVTLAGQRHVLDEPFFVLATENPIEMEGTYPLPEAQLDRFLFKVMVPAPSEDELVQVLGRTTGQATELPHAVASRAELLSAQRACRDVVLAEPVLRYAARLSRACDPTLPDALPAVKRALRVGPGVRGAQALVLGAKAVAVSSGRAHASFEDVQRVSKAALRHRMIRSFEGEAEDIALDDLVSAALTSVPTRPTDVAREASTAR